MSNSASFFDMIRFSGTYLILVVLFVVGAIWLINKLIVKWVEKNEVNRLIQAAEEALRKNLVQEALQYLNRLLEDFSGRVGPEEMGRIEFNLGLSYFSLASQENEALNLKRAIQFFTNILKNPVGSVDRSRVRMNLGNAYQRLAGVEGADENLEKAVETYREAARTWPGGDPVGYVQIQNSMSNALLALAQLRQKDKAILEKAVQASQEALRVKDIESLPLSFVQARNNLGEAYLELASLENGAENLERALSLFRETSELEYLQQYPDLFARTQNHLGQASLELAQLRQGDPALIEQAIACHEAVLGTIDAEGYPAEYAQAEHALGVAYLAKARLENPQENLRKAVEYLKDAAKIRNIQDYPGEYAATQDVLGRAYMELSRWEDAYENNWKAISAFNEALKVRNADTFSLEFASTQNRLGQAYMDFAQYGEARKNLSKAVHSFTETLNVLWAGRYPQEHAETRMNLGLAYMELAKHGDTDENMEQAIASFAEALKVSSMHRSQKERGEDTRISVDKAVAAFSEALRERRVDENPAFLRKYHEYLAKAGEAFSKALRSAPARPAAREGTPTKREDLARALRRGKPREKTLEQAVRDFELALLRRK